MGFHLGRHFVPDVGHTAPAVVAVDVGTDRGAVEAAGKLADLEEVAAVVGEDVKAGFAVVAAEYHAVLADWTSGIEVVVADVVADERASAARDDRVQPSRSAADDGFAGAACELANSTVQYAD